MSEHYLTAVAIAPYHMYIAGCRCGAVVRAPTPSMFVEALGAHEEQAREESRGSVPTHEGVMERNGVWFCDCGKRFEDFNDYVRHYTENLSE